MTSALELLIYGSIASLAVILVGESLLLHDPIDVAPEMMKLLRLDGVLTQDTMRIVSSSLITTGVFAFYTIVPVTHVLGTKSTSVGTAPWQRKARHFLFQFLSWTFYASCVLLSMVGLYASGWFWRQAAGFVASLGVLGMIAQVFMVSSFYVLESKFVGGQATISEKFTAAMRKLKGVNSFLSMNILLAVIAGGLAVLAEYSWWKKGNAMAAALEISLAVGLSIIVLFNTHGLGGRALHQRWAFWQPWVGGAKFVTLQIASWFLFGISIVLEVVFIVSTFVVGLEIFVGITAIAGVFCVFSELLLVGSLFLFRPEVQVTEVTSTLEHSATTASTLPQPPAIAQDEQTSAPVASTTAEDEKVVLQKTTVRLEKTVRMETREPSAFEQVYADAHRTLLILFIVNIQFVPFILLLVPFCMCGLNWADASAHWFAACLSIAAYTLAYAYIKAQIVDRARKIDDRDATQTKMWKWSYSAVLGVCMLIPICGAVAAFMYSSAAFPVWTSISVCHIAYVWGTYQGTPEISGCRTMKYQGEWHPALVRVGEQLRMYFKGRVIRTAELHADKLYVFGFHPHGIMPVTVLWLKLSNQWRSLFPGVDFSVLTASVIHLVPFMRDITQAFGGREVSRESFRSALLNKTNVLLVPGGQAEMLKSSSFASELKLVTRHAGFIKQAIQKGAELVPILSLGEVDMMDNVDMPTVQNWFLKRVGISVPFLPYGSFYLPIPRPVPVTIVVGKPIATKKNDNPSDQVIKEMKVAYYKQIRVMFEEHKQAAGNSHRQLVFVDTDEDMQKL